VTYLHHGTRLADELLTFLNITADETPSFAVIELAEDGRSYLTVHSPADADALIKAAAKAKALLEGACPECLAAPPGHTLTCPAIPAGPEHPAGPHAAPWGGVL
jgi:hypothetical protein